MLNHTTLGGPTTVRIRAKWWTEMIKDWNFIGIVTDGTKCPVSCRLLANSVHELSLS